ncbi:MAG TPA: thioredoxin-like domain-containing protein [Candidatus Acidoferrales bacterium]|nr:thioredoxin-like domain-containing protein [Candidatus Acidoferrales bacterium]
MEPNMLRSACFLFAALFWSFLGHAQTKVTGTVDGFDGKPMLCANVTLLRLPDYSPVKSVVVERDGKFEINIDSSGIWVLQFSGVFHQEHMTLLYIDKPGAIDVDVRLAAYHYLNDLDGAKVNSNVNNWYILKAVPMQKELGGTYSANIETNADSILYRLLGVREGDQVEGTQADKYVYNGTGGYNCVVTATNGRVGIILDPKKLPRSEKPERIAFVGTDPVISRFAEIYDELQHCRTTYQSALKNYIMSRTAQKQSKMDFSPILSSIKKEIKHERNKVLRRELYLNYITVAMMARQLDKSIYRESLKQISPSSIVWLVNPHSVYYALGHSGLTQIEQNKYVNEVLDENPEDRIKSALLYDEFMVAKLSEQTETAAHYYGLLTGRFQNTPEGQQLIKTLPHEYELRAGRSVPPFSLVSIDDSTKIISNETLKGKYYLLNFWATTDTESVDEVKLLSDVYEGYRHSNFEILSLSVDSISQNVTEFRKSKVKMPWLNAFLGKDINNEVVREFQANTIPDLILVNPRGIIVALGNELVGGNLEKKLTKLLK